MKNANEELEKRNVKEPIAVTGIGCRLPGGIHGPVQLWQGLKNGIDAISDVPANRWNLNAFYDPDPDKAGKVKTKKGGFLEEVDKFDADFFGIYPKTAERIDPQQRLLLEVTYEAFEDAGLKLEDISASKTAVYVGVFTNDYWDIQASSEQKDQLSPHVSMGVILTAIANRLSYTFNLKGPSVTIDTACSSSLVAVHMACQSIWTGESKQAIAGGVNVILKPETSIMMSKGNFLSPDGYCKSFDSRANGYVRSEGCGIVVLKPLSQAVADGDQIYGTILSTAVNQDGHTESGFTVPSLSSQVDMLETAYSRAGVDPASVVYVEAHGTGTPVGDPIETNAFGNVIGKGRKEGDECVIGSIKTNLGHLEAAAGVAGLIKLSLILKHKQVPKNLHFLNPNPKIPFEDYRLKVSTSLHDLPENGQPAICGVNSFGAGGTNAHVVMQGYRPAENNLKSNGHHKKPAINIFTVSARSNKALKDQVERFIEFVKTTDNQIEDICYSSLARRSWHPHRLAVAVKSKEDLIERLEAFLKDEKRPGMHTGQVNRKRTHRVGFIFSGQGPQWFAMGQQLMKTSPLFKQTILKIDELFSKIADWSLLEEMNKDENSSRIGETNIAQPAIMAVQIGLATLWKSRGVMPEGCIGHSIGEVAAAYTAGSLSLEQAVQVIYHRSRGQNKASNKGKMLAVGLPYVKAKKLINGFSETVSVAAINGPNIVTLSGDSEPLESIAENLDRQDIFHRFLRVNVPFHSHHMGPLKDELIKSLKHLQPRKAEISLYSTVTGKQENGLHLDSDYWYKNVREPVFFTDALQSMINDGYNTFVEIAPHPVLTNGAMELLKENKIKNPVIVPSLRRKEDEDVISMGSLSALFTEGFEVKCEYLFPENVKYVKLPGYIWQHQSYWFETDTHRHKRLGEDKHPFLLENTSMISDPDQMLWSLQLGAGTHPYLNDHKVDDTVVFPGTGHLEVAVAAGKSSFPESFSHLENIIFDKALFIPEEGDMDTKLEISSRDHQFRLFSRQHAEDASWIKNSEGKIVLQQDNTERVQLDINKIKDTVNEPVSVSGFYLDLKQNGLQYGETFRSVQRLWSAKMSLLGEVTLHESLQYGIEKYHFHPALLDSCLHMLEYAANWATDSDQPGIYLPVFLRKYKIYREVSDKVWCYIKVKEASEKALKADYFMLDDNGIVLAELLGLECAYIEGSRGENNIGVYEGFYDYIWDDISGEKENNDKLTTVSPLIFLNQGALGEKIVDDIHDRNQSSTIVTKGKNFRKFSDHHYQLNPDVPEDFDKLFKEVGQSTKIEKIAYLWPMDTALNSYLSDSQLEEQQKSLTATMLHFLQAVIRAEIEPALTMVVQATEKVLPNDKVNINQAAVYGLSRVMLNEYPFTKVSTIDLSEFPDDQEIRNLCDHLTSIDHHEINLSEIALRNDRRYFRKLMTVDQPYAESQAQKEINARNAAYALESGSGNSQIELLFRKVSHPAIKDDELEISVLAAACSDSFLNAPQPGLQLTGNEFAGVVTKIGKAVTRFREGDEVIAFGRNIIGGVIGVNQNLVVHKPSGWSFPDSVKLYKPLFSALYGLKHLGEIKKGDCIFIQAPLSLVELAAVEVAQSLGAKIISAHKTGQDESGERLTGDVISIDLQEDKAIEKLLALTGGKGIKLVIAYDNVSEIVMRSLSPFAKIVTLAPELNPVSTIQVSTADDLNISYHQVNVETILQYKPDISEELLNTIGEWTDSQNRLAHTVPVYPVHELGRLVDEHQPQPYAMKIMITMDQSIIPLSPANQLNIDANATYLITGGASGFGLILAKWLADNGAKHLALLSRSGCKYDRDYEIVDGMQANGVHVHLMKTDVSSQKDIQMTLNIIKESMPPLKGIIHSAALLDDGTIPNTNVDKFMRVFNPKVKGAWNLHIGTQRDDLDFFIMLSSVSSVIGWPGQVNYSSANNFLDRLALYRQSKGMVASSINLGVLDDYAGMTKSGEGGNLINVLYNQGWIPLTLKEVTEKIGAIIMQNPVQRMAANLDWMRFKDSFPHLLKDSRFNDIINKIMSKNAGQKDKGSLLDKIKEANKEEKESLLVENIVSSLAKILGVSSEKIAVDKPITGMGLDSLMLNQLRNWIQQTLELNYPLMRIAKGPNIYELSEHLLSDLATGNKTAVDSGNNGQQGLEKLEGIEFAGKWFMKSKANGKPTDFRVFCIHPVGAGASIFSHFLYNSPAGTEVLAYQLPGRENRAEEAPFEKVEALIPEMAKAMKPFLDKPFIVMGHSFGGIIGFELIHFIKKQYGIQPQHLFVTGTCAPHLTQAWKKTETITETAVAGNSTEKLLGLLNYIDDVDFLKSILPVMKRDMPLIMSYPYQDKGLLDFPVTAFAAEKDEVVTLKEVGSWQAQTSNVFELKIVEGDHWFLSRNKELILTKLEEAIGRHKKFTPVKI